MIVAAHNFRTCTKFVMQWTEYGRDMGSAFSVQGMKIKRKRKEDE